MPVIVLFLVLAIGGVFGFRALPIALSPDTSFPVAVVAAVDPGASPLEISQSVTEPLEDAVTAIPGVHHVLSQTSSGLATVTVEFSIGDNPDAAIAAVRAAVASAQARLPPNLQPPSVTKLDAQGGPALVYAAADPSLSRLALSELVRIRIKTTLSDLPGVSALAVLGAPTPEINIAVDPARLAALGLTLPALQQQIRAAASIPQAGIGTLGEQEAAVQTLAGYNSAASLGDLPVVLGPGTSVPLAAIASVHEAAAPTASLARLDGAPVVAFEIWQSPGADVLRLSSAVQTTLDGLTALYPHLVFTRVGGTVDATRSTYDTTIEALLEGLLLATATVWLFLRDTRATLIAALAMPLALLPAFLVLMLAGQSLNSITLLALALVVGILVDDAIVEIENIERHIAMGKRPYRAALDAADEIGPAVVATSFAIIAVFLPVSMMQGVVGQYFKPFGLTVAVAVFASLLVARLFTPVLAAFFLRPSPGGSWPQTPARRGWLAGYQKWLDYGLANPRISLAVAGGVLLLTVAIATQLPSGFLPLEDRDQSQFAFTLPPGSTVAASDAQAAKVIAQLRRAPSLQHDIQSVFALTGGATQLADQKQVLVIILLNAHRRRTEAQFEAALRSVLDQIPDLDWHMDNFGDNRDVELDFTGDDPAILDQAMRRFADATALLPGLSHAGTTLPPYATEISVTPKSALASTLGVSAGEVATTLALATGTVLPDAPVLAENGKQVPLRLELSGEANEAALGELPIQAGTGAVPLALVANLGVQPGPAEVTRLDRTSMEGVAADLLPGTTIGQALQAMRALPAYRSLTDAGISELEVGPVEFMNEMFSQLGFALGGGVLALLGVMLLLFRNWLQPLTILAVLPLSIGGALLALLIGGFALDLSSSIGLLTLLGIVTKNGILIVDAALAEERNGLGRLDAARAAGLRRARPVVMTTMAMVAGMIPVALVGGTGASLRLPMAVALMGGLIVSTALSLILVPVFYVMIGNFTDRIAPVFGRLVSTVPEDFT